MCQNSSLELHNQVTVLFLLLFAITVDQSFFDVMSTWSMNAHRQRQYALQKGFRKFAPWVILLFVNLTAVSQLVHACPDSSI